MKVLKLVTVIVILCVGNCKSNPALTINRYDDETNYIDSSEVSQKSKSQLKNPAFTRQDDDAELKVPELIAKNGFPCEIHHVVTEDGYILELHRIPHGRKSGSGPSAGKRVAFLQHGFLASSADWIMNTVDKALAYQLADQNYDVWLGNARGNTYSRNHTSLPPDHHAFWDFSYHEMAIYDIPAVIDHILETTKQEKLFYIGHSMGTVMFWICMSLRPQYNSKITLMSALAPVAYVEHIKSPVRILAPFATEAEMAAKLFGDREFLPHRGVINIFRRIVCENEPVGEAICENIVFLIAGFDKAQLNKTMLPTILGHTPAGTSTHTLLHFAQGINSGNFSRFDYGKSTNLELYGQIVPPSYDLSKISAPVALYYSDNDWLAPPVDVFRLAPQLQKVVNLYRVPYPKFTHLDFIFGIDSDKLLYKPVMDLMKLF